MPSGKYDAYIFKGADGQYKVRPAVAILAHKSKFSICNVSGLKAEVRIENTHLEAGEQAVSPVPNGGKAEFKLKEQLLDETGKSFSYKVRVETPDWQALPVSGESDPVIIIDPPSP
jgi:hypothetical protein